MSSTGQPSSSRMGWQPPSPQELHAQLPQYEIVEVLGMGGMGAVYKGFQTSLERFVAIKIMPPSFSDDDLQYAQRFKQEAKTMARLSHPGIVGVHDCGETRQGLLYIVMEFIEGTDVHRMIQAQGHLPADQAMAIIMHVCDALSYAHGNGIIHRDIKPANIMVDKLGRVKVADFGLAKVATMNSGLSSSNLTMGTPDYVAPEALVIGVEVDARADVYSVGVTLYEMLTGKVPRGRFEAASACIAGLDPRFDQVIDHAMRDNRDARYASAQELRDDLMRIHTTPMSQSGMRQAADRARVSTPRRHVVHESPEEEEAPSGPPVALIAVALLVVVGVGLLWWKPWAARETSSTSTPTMEIEKPSVEPTPKETASGSPAPAPAPPTPPVMAADSGKSTASPVEPPRPQPPQASPQAPTPVRPPVAVAPSRVLTPAPVPKSELDLRTETLDQQFKAAAERDTEPPFKASVATLDKGYLGALDRAMATSTQAGKLDEAVALRNEKQRVEKGADVPPVDDAGTPEVLQGLRKTYRSTFDKLQTDHMKALQPLYDRYDQALNSLQIELTKADKLDDAVKVKSLREKLGRLRNVGAISLLEDQGAGTLREETVVVFPDNPTGFNIGPLKSGDQITLSYVGGLWKSHGRIATVNPDLPASDGSTKDQLVIARAPEGNTPGAVLAIVPTGTASQPFSYTLSSGATLVLRINDNSDNKGNPGKVTYKLKITRAGGASSGTSASVPPSSNGTAIPDAASAVSSNTKLLPPGLTLTNSLGMKFVSVPGTQVLMCIHETRKKDYATYAAQNQGIDGSWKNPRDHNIPVSAGDDHPVVAVNWDDAKAFCDWLSKREKRNYRLPTDHEWSVAAGIGDREDANATPESLNSKIRDVYPWGNAWPPPNGVANLADTAFKKEFAGEPSLEGYTDGFATTAPVMSFAPNNLGIYDLAGNVWEWCEDFYNAAQTGHVLRGGSWWVEDRNRLITSFRSRNGPGIRYSHGGFRVVVVGAP